jgi:hypothetical protein
VLALAVVAESQAEARQALPEAKAEEEGDYAAAGQVRQTHLLLQHL